MHLLTFTLSNIHWVSEKVVLVLEKSKLASRFLIKLQSCNIYCNFWEKKTKSEVVRVYDDFTFLYIPKLSPIITILLFKKKMVEQMTTFLVMSSSTIMTCPYFKKKKFNEPIFTIFTLKEPQNTKKSQNKHQSSS